MPPADLPEQFKGANADEVLGKLLPAYKGARDTLAKQPAPPKSADEYTFKPSDKIAPYFKPGADGKEDPFLAAARNAAFKAGVSPQAFDGFVNTIFDQAIEGGLLGAPFDEKAEIKTFGTALGLADDRATATALNEAYSFAEGLFGQLQGVPEAQKDAVKDALIGLTDTAAGNLLLRALQARMGSPAVRIAGNPQQQGAFTRADLQTLSMDPRIDPANRNHSDPNKRFDPALRQRYDDAYAALGAKA